VKAVSITRRWAFFRPLRISAKPVVRSTAAVALRVAFTAGSRECRSGDRRSMFFPREGFKSAIKRIIASGSEVR